MMKSKRRVVGLCFGCIALVALGVWLTRDRGPGGASTALKSSGRFETEDAREDSAATDDMADSDSAADDADSDGSTRVDFTGTWVVDTEVSDPINAILTAIGLSFIERALVNNTTITYVISQSPDELTLEIPAPGFSRTDHLLFSGEPSETTDPGGRPVQSISSWSDDGKQLITKIWVKPQDQHFTMTRSLNKRQRTMEVFVEFFPKDGETMTSRRVYRRTDAGDATKS